MIPTGHSDGNRKTPLSQPPYLDFPRPRKTNSVRGSPPGPPQLDGGQARRFPLLYPAGLLLLYTRGSEAMLPFSLSATIGHGYDVLPFSTRRRLDGCTGNRGTSRGWC